MVIFSPTMNSLEMQEYNTEDISLLTSNEEQRDWWLRRKGNKKLIMETKKEGKKKVKERWKQMTYVCNTQVDSRCSV